MAKSYYKYIAHHEYKQVGVGGEKLDIKKGERLYNICGLLCTKDGKGVCYAHSQNAKLHFAQDDDGCGAERGKITYKIAFGDRRRKSKIAKRWQRFSDDEIRVLVKEYKHWLRQDVDTIIFNNEFFEADIGALRGLASQLGIN